MDKANFREKFVQLSKRFGVFERFWLLCLLSVVDWMWIWLSLYNMHRSKMYYESFITRFIAAAFSSTTWKHSLGVLAIKIFVWNVKTSSLNFRRLTQNFCSKLITKIQKVDHNLTLKNLKQSDFAFYSLCYATIHPNTIHTSNMDKMNWIRIIGNKIKDNKFTALGDNLWLSIGQLCTLW